MASMQFVAPLILYLQYLPDAGKDRYLVAHTTDTLLLGDLQTKKL